MTDTSDSNPGAAPPEVVLRSPLLAQQVMAAFELSMKLGEVEVADHLLDALRELEGHPSQAA